MSKRLLRVSKRTRIACMPPVLEASSLTSPGSRSKGQIEVGGIAKAVLALQRARDLLFDVLTLERAGQTRDRDFLRSLSVDADYLMRPQRVEHLRDRQRAGGAEIRRAIDRDLRGSSGIVDDVADPHQIARHRNAGAQRRAPR
jgi:hypothetical protein